MPAYPYTCGVLLPCTERGFLFNSSPGMVPGLSLLFTVSSKAMETEAVAPLDLGNALSVNAGYHAPSTAWSSHVQWLL